MAPIAPRPRSLVEHPIAHRDITVSTCSPANRLQDHIAKRQTTVAIPALYQTQDSSPSPAAVVGIVLGSVAAFLILIWLFSTLTNINISEPAEEAVVVERRRSHSPRSRRSRRTERSTRSHRGDRNVREVREVRDTSRAPRREYVVREDSRRRDEPGMDTVEVVEHEPSEVSEIYRSTSRVRRSSRH